MTALATVEVWVSRAVQRTAADGTIVPCDVLVSAEVSMTSRGSPAVMHTSGGDPGWPAEDPEFEVSYASAELDGECEDAPGPLTDSEIGELRDWVEAGPGCERAIRAAIDDGIMKDQRDDG